MRLRSVHIENFRGIEVFDIANLKDLVVIAGPNGCGKTCVLDGIRLLKSVCGGYSVNEWQTWFGEFQISISEPEAVLRLFRDRQRSLIISTEIELSDVEQDYINLHAEEILRPIVWGQKLGRNTGFRAQPISATELTQHGEEVVSIVQTQALQLREDVKKQIHPTRLQITPAPQIRAETDLLIQTIFQTYMPERLGVIDYHSSSRVYEREAVGQVNLDLTNVTQQRRQHLLYNWREKYKNVKTELAANYVLSIIASKASESNVPDVNDTLGELFRIFFPGKQYLGPQPQPDGRLSFPVRLESGGQHDIDELSSGEKELLYGYLRLRNSAPRNSVVLLDEPELHLNPRLQQGLPDFYHTHLGKALNNQLWLVTHSDTLLRQAVGNPNYSVFHISPPKTQQLNSAQVENQVAAVTVTDNLEQAVVSIVGDLAAYKPRGKVVIVEGGGDTEFDVEMLTNLFPNFAERVNLVPGGSKRRVRDLYQILQAMRDRAALSERFFAIVDRDRDTTPSPLEDNVHKWDRYHIENYLLESDYIFAASKGVLGNRVVQLIPDLDDALRGCAESLIDRLILERLQDEINDEMKRSLSIGARPDTHNPAIDIIPSIHGSLTKLNQLGTKYSREYLTQREVEIRQTLEVALTSDEWKCEFPGRSVLKRYVERFVHGISYDAFRYLIIEKMVDGKYEPPGMAAIIKEITTI
jgi:predicted ATPase